MNNWIYKLPWDLIDYAAEINKLDLFLLASIIQVESAGNDLAVRYESKWSYVYNAESFAKNCGITKQTEKFMQSCSYGLMQIMGTVARELGLHDIPLSVLFNPEKNLEYGCKKLNDLFYRYKDETDIVSAYNQGSPRKTKGGMYLNQTYVDKVCKRLHELRKTD